MTPLEKARAAMEARRAAGEVIERVGPLEKARRKPTSLRLAITAMCVRCMGGDDTSPQRRAIRECTAPSCPLHPVRPYQQRSGRPADDRPDTCGRCAGTGSDLPPAPGALCTGCNGTGEL